MSRFLGSLLLVGGFALVPLSIRASGDQAPKLAVSEACAQGGSCCYELLSICVVGNQAFPNMRSSDGQPCKPPRPGG
jgi:hypothetical protein